MATTNVRTATEHDVEACCSLLAEVFPDSPKADPAVYEWQYWANPFAPPHSMVAETAEDGLVAHVGLFAMPGVVDGRPCVLGHNGDALVLPGWRGGGLYTRLTHDAYVAAAEHGYAATLCIPNSRSRNATIRAGLVMQHRLRGLLAARALPPPLARRGLATAEVAEPVAEVDDLPTTLRNQAGIRLDLSWFNWRYRDHPTIRYRYFATHGPRGLRAFAVTAAVHREEGRFTYVMDVVADGVFAAARCLRDVVAAQRWTRLVSVLAVPGTWQRRAALAGGFAPIPGPLEPQPQYLGLSRQSIGRSRTWQASWGNHDHL